MIGCCCWNGQNTHNQNKMMNNDRFYVLSDNTGRFVCKSRITGNCYYVTPEPLMYKDTLSIPLFQMFKTSDNWSDYNELIGYGTNPIQKAIDADIEFEKVQPKI